MMIETTSIAVNITDSIGYDTACMVMNLSYIQHKEVINSTDKQKPSFFILNVSVFTALS